MGSLASMVEALVGGYLTAVLLQAGLGFLITREGRGLLMRGDRLSEAFYLQLGIAWLLSAAAAAVVVKTLLPFSPMAPAVTGVVGLLLILMVLRNHFKTPHQQALAVNVLLFLCIAAGTATGYVLRLKA